jgi:hypothetical protein
MDAIETTPMKSILQRGIGGITIPTTRLSRFPITRKGVMIMTRNEWQPIETAPKDGSDILLFTPCLNKVKGEHVGIFQGRYLKEFGPSWIVVSFMFDVLWASEKGWGSEMSVPGIRIDSPLAPTHWMPLPEPPK